MDDFEIHAQYMLMFSDNFYISTCICKDSQYEYKYMIVEKDKISTSLIMTVTISPNYRVKKEGKKHS